MDSCEVKLMESIESRVTQNFIEAIAAAAIGCDGVVRRFDGVTCVRTPIPLDAFNSAFAVDKVAVQPAALERAQSFFEGSKSEWRYVLPPSLSSFSWEIPQHIAVSKWTKEPEMVMLSNQASFRPIPPDLKIRQVQNLKDLALWNRTLALGFETGTADFFDHFNRPAFLSTERASMYLGECSQMPVATSFLYVSDDVAGIYGVSTLPEFRGRGFGAALTAFAVKEGFSRGCDLASLQASPVGVPVYFRLGFRFIFDYECWIISPRTQLSKQT